MNLVSDHIPFCFYLLRADVCESVHGAAWRGGETPVESDDVSFP